MKKPALYGGVSAGLSRFGRKMSSQIKKSQPVSAADHPFDPMQFDLHEIGIHKANSSAELGIFVRVQVISRGVQPYITRTAPGSPAEKAGMQMGDYVLAVNGHRIETKEQMAEEVQRIQEGLVELTVARLRLKPLTPLELKPPGGAPRRPNHNYHLCRLDPMHRPQMGMVLTTASNEVTVDSVALDGLAFWAGLQSRDRLLTIASEPVNDLQQCQELLKKYEGRLMDILIERPADAECSQHCQALDKHEPLQLQKVDVVANTVEAGVPDAPAEVASLMKKRMEGIMKNLRVGVHKRKKKKHHHHGKGKEKSKKPHSRTAESSGSQGSAPKKGK